jgi:hypothetical protein
MNQVNITNCGVFVRLKIACRFLDGRMSLEKERETWLGFAQYTKPGELPRAREGGYNCSWLDGVADLGGGALLIHGVAVYFETQDDLIYQK